MNRFLHTTIQVIIDFAHTTSQRVFRFVQTTINGHYIFQHDIDAEILSSQQGIGYWVIGSSFKVE